MKSTTPIQDRLEKQFEIIAWSSLYFNGEPVFKENIEAEASRIERCVEHFYVKEKHDLHYPEFALKFLDKNCRKIIYGDEFLGDWNDDVVESTSSTSINDFSLIV